MKKRPPEIAYEVIKQKITSGEFTPSQRLIEEQLSRELSLSRHNVRLALQKLENDGLVDIEPNKGASVSTVTLEQALDTLETRKLLEMEITRHAAGKFTSEQLQDLAGYLEEMSAMLDAQRFDEYSALNRKFHGLIHAVSGRPTIAWLINLLRQRMSRLQMRTILIPGRSSISLAEHREIYEALAASDPDRAGKAAAAHLESLEIIVRDAWGLVKS